MFSNPDGTALNAEGLSADAGMFLRAGAQCTGEVNLLGAHIGGQLDCSEGVFSNPDGVALNAERLTVDASMFLRAAQCTGQVRLHDAHVDRLDCDTPLRQPRDTSTPCIARITRTPGSSRVGPSATTTPSSSDLGGEPVRGMVNPRYGAGEALIAHCAGGRHRHRARGQRLVGASGRTRSGWSSTGEIRATRAGEAARMRL